METIGIYRVHSVVRFPEYEKGGAKASDNARIKHVVTVWDIVPASDVDHALAQIRSKHMRDGHIIERIYSFNHLGDLTVLEDFGWSPGI